MELENTTKSKKSEIKKESSKDKKSSKKEKKVKKQKKDKKEKDSTKKKDKSTKKKDKSTKKKDKDSRVKKKRKRSEESTNVSRKKKKLGNIQEITITEEDESPPISNFRVSQETQDALAKHGITTLFPIQARCFDFVYDGLDVIGRARTGTGKTLSFCLPIIEKLLLSDVKKLRGRGPRMVVLAPTRELAIQVEKVVQIIAQDLESICIYGGTSYNTQEWAITRGLDIVVGTPGRILDHLNRGILTFNNVEYFVCDEADEMLNMGFREDVETIINIFQKRMTNKLSYIQQPCQTG
jgi:ATP-dependent RNA helicase DDX21